VRELRWFNGVPVAFFQEVADRTAAESIVRAILWIDEATVLASTEDNAWYDHQLVGLEVRRDGVGVGTVAEVQHFPAQDLLSVETAGGIVLVPFVEAIVPSVDLEAGVVTVTPPAGLFEDLPVEADGAAGDAQGDVESAPQREGE
jgi:16S rRNA processing protein RimM